MEIKRRIIKGDVFKKVGVDSYIAVCGIASYHRYYVVNVLISPTDVVFAPIPKMREVSKKTLETRYDQCAICCPAAKIYKVK
jgi:hypothetical protein